jgi:hypothetical protein
MDVSAAVKSENMWNSCISGSPSIVLQTSLEACDNAAISASWLHALFARGSIKTCEVSSEWVFYQHSTIVNQEVVRMEDDKFIFSTDILYSDDQPMSMYITAKPSPHLEPVNISIFSGIWSTNLCNFIMVVVVFLGLSSDILQKVQSEKLHKCHDGNGVGETL